MTKNTGDSDSRVSTPAVEVREISKRYGAVKALKPVSFSVAAGSYFVLLGPSGGGKTTTLRLIGGLIKPTEGRVLINGNDVTAIAANQRDTTMVFQSYALFPHMSVAGNVAYGLTLKKVDADEIKTRVDEMLDMVGLTGLDRRMPHELSGGQQQRVQLARSLILQSSVLLLDEPLAALDASLRKSMCIELKRLQESVGITFIHVTHNQEEAMTIADEIALIADGELVESGDVRQVYERPSRRFTAEFFGESTVIDGTVSAVTKERIEVDVGFDWLRAALPDNLDSLPEVGVEVAVSVRSECITFVNEDQHTEEVNRIEGVYVSGHYLGFYTRHEVKLPNDVSLYVRAAPFAARTLRHRPGDAVVVRIDPNDVCLHLS